MLIQFNFENFKSFLEEASLDMTSMSIKEHPYNLIEIKNTKSVENYVKVAAIYGANASGKSSVIEAFKFMRFFIRHSFKSAADHKLIPVNQFAFSDEEKESTFEVFFRTKNQNEYQYGFTITREAVVEEWLYKRDFKTKHSFKPVFEREGQKFSSLNLNGAKNFTSMVGERTLFLSILSNAEIPMIKEVYDWFVEATIIDFGDASLEYMLTQSIPTDIEIEDVSIREEIVRFMNAIDVPIGGLEYEKVMEDGEPKYKLYSIYHYNDEVIRLPFSQESSGTIKMFTLYLHLKSVLKDGSVIFIDELDAKLHPLLLRSIITMFHDEKKNPNDAQLIYTTHDNYTLAKDIFRRDQIWFVEKQPNLKAELYSLAEYKMEDNKKVRYDASFNKGYLLGRYGGVPILKEFSLRGTENEE